MIFCKCGMVMKVLKVGVSCVDLDEAGELYSLHSGDVHRCPVCGNTAVQANPNPYLRKGQKSFLGEIDALMQNNKLWPLKIIPDVKPEVMQEDHLTTREEEE